MKASGLIVSFLFLANIHCVLAQNVQLKAPLSADDETFLKKELIKNLCDFDPGFSCTLPLMNIDSLSPQLQANKKNLTLLRKDLKGNINDAPVYSLMADIFNRLKMQDSVEYYEKKALADYDVLIAKKPDSTDLYQLAGLGCLTAGFTDRAISYYKAELSIKPTHSGAIAYLSMAYVFKGDPDSVYIVIASHLHKYPDDEDAYYMLPFYSAYKLAQHQNDTAYLKKLSIDSAVSVPLLDKYNASHPDSFDIKLWHYEALQVLLVERIDLEITTGIDSTILTKDRKFFLKPEENDMLTKTKGFFESCLNNKSSTYRYCSNKYLAISYLYLNQPGKAIPYLKEAIKLFPEKKASSLFNADDDYNNLLAAYTIVHDTDSFEKLLLKKIKVLPKVDPEAEDYVKLSEMAIIRNKLKNAREYCDEALAVDTLNSNAVIISGLLYYLDKNYGMATKEINKAYKIDNTNSCMYLLYGAILLEQNNLYNSYEVFKFANKYAGNYPIANSMLSRFFTVKN